MGSVEPGFNNVIVVGGGPAGMLLTLRLAQSKIPVTLLDMYADVDDNPRATHYGPPAMVELDRAQVGDAVRSTGFVPNTASWRKLDGTRLTAMSQDGPLSGYPDLTTCLPISQLGVLLRDQIRDCGGVDILYNHKVTNIGQDEKEAWVEVETPSGSRTMKASYIVGCDGARSQIRRSLFGEDGFPGKTWEYQVVATNTYYNLDKYGWDDANYIIHPEHWFMAAKITKDGLWRITYGEKAGLTDEQLRERQPGKFKALLPGNPDPDQYKLVNFSPYKIHQRLAKSMRDGRFLLAGDAAHLCNPFGGQGLTGGIVDVGNLADCLEGLYQNKADPSILDKYSEIRRQKFEEVVNPMTSHNLLRLCEQDPDTAVETDQLLSLLKKAETDPSIAEMIHKGAHVMQHDFRQYYH